MNLLFLSLPVLLSILFVNPTSCSTFINHKDEVIRFLQSFGYLPESKNTTEISRKQLHHALRRLQINDHIEVTGRIDENIIKLIKTPRCGVNDNIRSRKRQKRYDLLHSKWNKHHITWSFNHKHGRFKNEEPKIRYVLSKALEVWSRYSVLTFEEVSDPKSADIEISFEEIYHPDLDRYPMNDPVLAHAHRPGSGVGGDVHFRVDLDWNFDVMYDEEPPSGEKSFFSVALHELGHSIGLGHSEHREAVMYSFYTKPRGTLSRDDINGIQHVYGAPRTRTYHNLVTDPPISENDSPEIIPEKCDTSYDAILRIRGELFIFKGKYLFRPDSNSDAIEIRKMWSELPEDFTHVDAVHEDENGKISFFIGQDIFVFNLLTFEYKSSLSEIGIDHHFNKIDAIFKWSRYDATYIFSGDQYWKMNGDVVDRHYPKDIHRVWRDVYDVDTVFEDNGKLYFFMGKFFHEFSTEKMRLNRMDRKPSAQNFMNCPGEKLITKLASRFDDQDPDVIDEPTDGEEQEDDFDEENNPEFHRLKSVTAGNESNDVTSIHNLVFPIILASLAISQVLSSISLYF